MKNCIIDGHTIQAQTQPAYNKVSATVLNYFKSSGKVSFLLVQRNILFHFVRKSVWLVFDIL